MSNFRWEVKHYAGGASGTETLLTGITSIVIDGGRSAVQDPLRASTLTVTGNSTSTLPTMTIGDVVTVQPFWQSEGTQAISFSFTLSDFARTYDIASAADTWTMQGECALAILGRHFLASAITRGSGNAPITDAGAVVNTATGIIVNTAVGDAGTVTKCSGQTFAIGDNLFDIVQTYARTEQAWVYGSYGDLYWKNRKNKWSLTPSVEFTDGTLSAIYTTAKYYDIEFLSSADTNATKVVVEASGLAPTSAGSGNRTFNLSSYDQTVEQATYLAGYVAGTLNASTAVPQSLSWNSEAQTNKTPITILGLALATKARINVVFRGTRYDCVVEGFRLTAGLDQVTVTLNLSSFDAYKFFVLDSATQGIIGTSRLGY